MFQSSHYHQQILVNRLAEISRNNQLLIEQFNQLCQQMLWALDENRTLRREIVELTVDVNSILQDQLSTTQRCLVLQQELATKTARIVELENHIKKLAEKITLLETELANSISRTQITNHNAVVTSEGANTQSSSRNSPNHH